MNQPQPRNQQPTGSFECIQCHRTVKSQPIGQHLFCSRSCNRTYVAEQGQKGQEESDARHRDASACP